MLAEFPSGYGGVDRPDPVVLSTLAWTLARAMKPEDRLWIYGGGTTAGPGNAVPAHRSR